MRTLGELMLERVTGARCEQAPHVEAAVNATLPEGVTFEAMPTEPAPPPSEAPPPIEIPRLGIVRGLSAALYHDDPCDTPSLSASVAKILHAQSPAHAWAAHPKLGRAPRPGTAALSDGQILHAIVLGREDLDLEIVEADSFRTKRAKEARDAGKAEGRTPIPRPKFDRMAEIVERWIRPQLPAAFRVPVVEDTEVSLFWDEGDTRCRARVDMVDWEGPGASADIFDLKGTESAHPDKITRAIDDYGYAIQEIAYVSGWTKFADSRVRFTFLFVEHEPPYVVTPVELSEAWRTVGRARWARAVELWSKCLARGTKREAWPAYVTEGENAVVQPPTWVIRNELDREVA